MKTPPYILIIAWMVVVLPLSWGIYKSVIKSRPLFLQSPATTNK